MKKTIPIIIALVAIIGLGIYDYQKKMDEKKENESSVSNDVKPTARTEAPSVTPTGQTGISEGDTAPDFQLSDLNGKSIKLSDYRGKNVIINLWATWCPPCKAEMPHMQAFYEEQKEKTAIVAVNLTKLEKDSNAPKDFAKEYGLTFPVVMDRDGTTGETYQAYSMPTSYILNDKGVIQKKVIGPMSKEFMEEAISSID